jgi:hypothetical protein
MAGLRSVSSARLRCARILWAIAGRPRESEAGVERGTLEGGALRAEREAWREGGRAGRRRRAAARGGRGAAVGAWRALAETHDQQQPTTTRVYAPRSDNGTRGTSDNKTLPEYSPRPACDGCAIGSHVQKTGVSGEKYPPLSHEPKPKLFRV